MPSRIATGLACVAATTHYLVSWLRLIAEYLLLACGLHPAKRLLNKIRGRTDLDPEEAEHARQLVCAYGSMPAATAAVIEVARRRYSEALSRAVDDSGYNVLQQAVAKDDVPFVRLLLQLGCSPNAGRRCSRPLHLAAQAGKLHLVHMLLKAGARATARCGMCFPQPHVDRYASYAKFFFINHSSSCDGRERDAIQIAIDGDHADIVEAFYYHNACAFKGKYYLHRACESGAVRCVRYLVERASPLQLEEIDESGYTPLARSLRGRGDASVTRYLADSGADVHRLATTLGGGGSRGCRRGPTALHVLFELDTAACDIVAKTRLVLGLGVEANTNARDEQANTPLHCAACLFADRIRLWRVRGCEADAVCSVLAAVRLLLSHNADPCVVDSERRLPLWRILVASRECLAVQSGSGGESAGGEPCHSDESCRLVNDVCFVVNDFVANRFPANAPLADDGLTAMCIVVDIILTWWLRADNLGRTTVDAVRPLVESLVSRGADMNVRFRGKKGIVSIWASHARRVLAMPRDCTRSQAAAFLDDFLALLFELGLNPNNRPDDNCVSEEESANVNALSTLISQLHQPAVRSGVAASRRLAVLCTWLRTVLVWGGDPDLEPYRADPVICTSQANIFLKVAASHPVKHLVQEMCDGPWLDDEEAAAAVGVMIRLLVSCMSHEPLVKALDSSGGGGSTSSMRSLLARCSGKDWAPTHLASLGSARSLKQLCRVAVMTSLRRQTAKYVHKLPLPYRLRRYMLLLDG